MINLLIWLIFIWFITFCVNICINQLICFLYRLHVVSINRTLPISNNIKRSCSLFSCSLFFLSFFPLLLASFYNTLSTRCFNQLRVSESFFFSLRIMFCVSQSILFLTLSSFTILSHILIHWIKIVWLNQFSSSSYYYYYYYYYYYGYYYYHYYFMY